MTLKVYNSKVEIVTGDEDLLQKCKKLLSIYWADPRNPTTFLSVYLGRGNFFPSGFLSQFEKKAKNKKIAYQTEDLTSDQVQRQNFKFNCPLEYKPHQEKALEAVKTHRVGIVSSPTASGKSLMIAATVADKSTTTLIITPTELTRDDLAANYREWFGQRSVSTEVPVKPWSPGLKVVTPEMVEEDELKEPEDENPFAYMLNRGKKKVKENPFERMKRMQTEAVKKKIANGSWYKPITILCWNSLPLLPKEYIEKLGLVIIDECHTASVKAIRDLLFKAEGAYFRYGFSGTPWRDQPHMLKLMQSAIGEHIIFDYSPEEAIEDEVIAKPNLNIIQGGFPTKFMKGVKNYRSIIDDGIIRNKARNQQIVKKAIELYDDNHQVFIAIAESQHFEGKLIDVSKEDEFPKRFVREKDISYCLKSLFEETNQPIIFISGDDSGPEKRAKLKQLRESEGGFILIGTMAVGIGADIPGINKIILGETGKSSIQFFQRIGRGLRTNNEDGKQLEVFMFMDRWNAKAKAFSIERVKMFAKYYKGCKVFGF